MIDASLINVYDYKMQNIVDENECRWVEVMVLIVYGCRKMEEEEMLGIHILHNYRRQLKVSFSRTKERP